MCDFPAKGHGKASGGIRRFAAFCGPNDQQEIWRILSTPIFINY